LQVLSVEFFHVQSGKSTLKDFMTRQGFSVAGEVINKFNLANDYIFVNNMFKYQ